MKKLRGTTWDESVRAARACALTAGTVVWLASGTAQAQQGDQLLGKERAQITSLRLQRAMDPSLTSAVVAPSPALVWSSVDGGQISALMALQYGRLTFDAKVSGPTKKTGVTELADQNGLRSKATLEFGVGTSTWPKPTAAELEPLCNRIATRRSTARANVTCRDVEDIRKEEELTGEQFLRYMEPARVFHYRVSRSQSRETFEFLDAATYDPASPETHVSSTTKFAAAWLTRTNWVLVGNYQRQETFTASDPVQVCRQVTPGVSTCKDAVIGQPEHTARAEVYQAEARRVLSDELAVSPRLTWNKTKHVKTFDLPLYFIKEKDKLGLTGGINVRWTTAQTGASVILFVGKAFDPFTLAP